MPIIFCTHTFQGLAQQHLSREWKRATGYSLVPKDWRIDLDDPRVYPRATVYPVYVRFFGNHEDVAKSIVDPGTGRMQIKIKGTKNFFQFEICDEPFEIDREIPGIPKAAPKAVATPPSQDPLVPTLMARIQELEEEAVFAGIRATNAEEANNAACVGLEMDDLDMMLRDCSDHAFIDVAQLMTMYESMHRTCEGLRKKVAILTQQATLNEQMAALTDEMAALCE